MLAVDFDFQDTVFSSQTYEQVSMWIVVKPSLYDIQAVCSGSETTLHARPAGMLAGVGAGVIPTAALGAIDPPTNTDPKSGLN